MQIDIQGTEKFIKSLDEITKKLQSNELKEFIGQKAIETVNKIAFENLGHSNEYIKHNKMKIIDDGILIYNDVKNENGEYYSLIVEFGSGVYAEMNHMGNSETFTSSGYVYWYVPESKATKLSSYSYKKITTKEGENLYMVYGQYPSHIYSDASITIKRNLTRWIGQFLTQNKGGTK